MRMRPAKHDVVIRQNSLVYASFTEVGGRWMRGLFARKRLGAGVVLAQYTGKVMPMREGLRVRDSAYLMDATHADRRRRRVVIDGHPRHGAAGLASFANYAPWCVSNALFVDHISAAPRGEGTYVLLVARAPISKGQEIRVDYDTGSRTRPFRAQLLAEGVDAGALGSDEYTKPRWTFPARSLRNALRADPPTRSVEAAALARFVSQVDAAQARHRADCA